MVFFIHQEWAHDLKSYVGDDPGVLMTKAMLARGELVALDRIQIREAPPVEEQTVRIGKTPDQQAYLRLSKHWKGGRR